MGNNAYLDNTLAREAVDLLRAKLPPGWRISGTSLSKRERAGGDAILRIRGPGSMSASMLMEAKNRLEPKDVERWTLDPKRELPVLVVAPFLSPRVRERLRTRGFSYADLTGNTAISLSKPGLYIETHGADRNPDPLARDRRSLKGAKAGRLIRALCDFRPPIGLRALAARAGVDAGYASRIVDYLRAQALVTQPPRGPIADTDWPGLLRRWAEEYSPFKRGRVHWYLAARGLASLIDALRPTSERYAVSASWAAAQLAPIAPPRLLLCYADNIPSFARSLDLRPADAGSNVVLLTPFDPVVYERTSQQKGITVAAPSQIVADLLTSPGRAPNEAEELLEWMRENENAWRA